MVHDMGAMILLSGGDDERTIREALGRSATRHILKADGTDLGNATGGLWYMESEAGETLILVAAVSAGLQ